MSDRPGKTWAIEPHTRAKLDILRFYLQAWFPILSTGGFPRIVYIDGFAGPGRYAGGEEGSPLVALNAALKQPLPLRSIIEFHFVELDPQCLARLEHEIESLRPELQQRPNVQVTIHKEQNFAEAYDRICPRLGEDRRTVPTFALIDPFGFSGIPYGLISRLLSKNKCEVLITFVVDAINRWLTHPDAHIRSHIIETFGTDAAIAIAEGAGDRAIHLKNLYQQQLGKVAQFVRYFEMRDSKDRVVYYLFFASNNSLGHLKMKEAMWKVDPLGDFRFSDSTNPNQQVLFSNPSVEPLVTDLDSRFLGVAQIPIKQVETYVQDKTPYLRKHMTEALTQLESDGRLKVAELKTNDKRRRSGTYPNDALLSFQKHTI